MRRERKRLGPNDRVNVAVIGAGGKGAGNMMALVSQNIVAAADVDFDRVGRQMLDRNGALRPEREPLKAAYDKTRRFTDYRRMFDTRKDIEAVVIATPDHHHALCARMAMERGIHVYVQKPLTNTVRESRMLLELSRRYPQLVTQMGNQGHSGDDGRRVVELIRGGAIGKVQRRPDLDQPADLAAGHCAACARSLCPAGLDWDTWLGPADVNWGYHPDYAHFNWRGWLPFGSGALGDMGAHLIDFPVWALEPGLPTRIETRHTLWGGDTNQGDGKPPAELTSFPVGSITHYEFGAAKGGPVTITWHDGGLMPPTPRGMPPGRIMEAEGGVLFIGDRGMLIHDTYGENPTLIGEEALARAQAIPQIASAHRRRLGRPRDELDPRDTWRRDDLLAVRGFLSAQRDDASGHRCAARRTADRIRRRARADHEPGRRQCAARPALSQGLGALGQERACFRSAARKASKSNDLTLRADRMGAPFRSQFSRLAREMFYRLSICEGQAGVVRQNSGGVALVEVLFF